MPKVIDDPFSELTNEEIAVFCFTAENAGNDSPNQSRPLVVPSKDAIIWSVCIERLYNKYKETSFDELDQLLRYTVRPTLSNFINHYTNFENRSRKSLSPYQVPLGAYTDLFGLPRSAISTRRIEDFRRTEALLEEKGLIVDPLTFEIPGAAILILSFAPVEFSLKTEKGKELYFKMNTTILELELSKKQDELKFNSKVKIFKLAELFKKHIGEVVMNKEEERDE